MEKVTLYREKEEYKLFDAVMKDFRIYRQKIYLFVTISVLAALLIVLLVPNRYQATAYIMPDSSSPSNRLAELASSIVPSGLLSSSLMPAANSEGEKMISLFSRNRVTDSILSKTYTELERFDNGNLYELFNIDNKQYARDNLLAHLTMSENKKNGIISVSAETEDRILSAKIANTAVAELDKFKSELNKKDATQNREFYSEQLSLFNDKLINIENKQSSFLAKNKNYLTATDPVLRQQVAEFEKQIIFYSKLVYSMKQLIIAAEIEMNRVTPTIKIIESAEIPIVKSGPPRTKYMLFTVIGSILFALGMIVAKNAYNWYFPDNTKNELRESVDTIKEDLDTVVSRFRFKEKDEVVK
ncbi:MAG: hypothetical protein DWP97_11525 [Calditrichaeota bacterium]|nr:MAG: hypothetical protein DWP97_11525 [Calditrichota bacterium]